MEIPIENTNSTIPIPIPIENNSMIINQSYDYYKKDYLKRHPSGNILSLETLIYNKLILCELVNRPIQLKSRLNYSFWIEIDQEHKEYAYFTTNKSILLIGDSKVNTFKNRLLKRKEYERLINKEFEYHSETNIRISSPHRIFICNSTHIYNLNDLKNIISESFNYISTNKNGERDRWNTIIQSIYHWDIPIDAYYKLGKYPRHEDIFIDEYLKNINAIGDQYINNTHKTIFTNNVIYSYKYHKKMNILLFDKSRELYNSKSWFRRLFVNQLLLTDHLFYKLNYPYDYCYINCIHQKNKDNIKVNEDYFHYEFNYDEFRESFKEIINNIDIEIDLIEFEFSDDEEEEVDNELHNKKLEEYITPTTSNDSDSIIKNKVYDKEDEDDNENMKLLLLSMNTDEDDNDNDDENKSKKGEKVIINLIDDDNNHPTIHPTNDTSNHNTTTTTSLLKKRKFHTMINNEINNIGENNEIPWIQRKSSKRV
jgi:hypothetical protein